MTRPPDFVITWAHETGPRQVLDAARARFERGQLGVRSTIQVSLSDVERAEVGKMLPAEWLAGSGPVPTKSLREGLEHHGTTLEAVLVAVGGPLRDRRAEARAARERAATERAQAVDDLVELLGINVPQDRDQGIRAELDRWVLRRVPPRARAEAVATVVSRLPSNGHVALAVLAAQVLGDAHALDRSKPLGRAVARFLGVRAAAGNGGTMAVDPVLVPEAWRAAWAEGGVSCDAVSSQVLVLNLPLVGDAPAVALCAAVPGEPTWLTLHSLRGTFALAEPSDVFVCENPSIVEAAAAKFGAATRPLVCTFGRPASALWELLRGLGHHARLRVRADGDATGWSIVKGLLTELPNATPWRMPPDCVAFEEQLLDELLVDVRD